ESAGRPGPQRFDPRDHDRRHSGAKPDVEQGGGGPPSRGVAPRRRPAGSGLSPATSRIGVGRGRLLSQGPPLLDCGYAVLHPDGSRGPEQIVIEELLHPNVPVALVRVRGWPVWFTVVIDQPCRLPEAAEPEE